MADFKSDAEKAIKEGRENTDIASDKSALSDLRAELERILPKIAEASIRKLPPEFILSTALTLIRSNEGVRKCTPASIIHGIIQSAQLGLRLDPALGHAALVPRHNRKTNAMEAQFTPMYKGILLRVLRSGKVRTVVAQVVHEKDSFEAEFGSDQKLVHRVSLGERGEMTHFYALAKLDNGEVQFEVMTIKDVNDIKQRSNAGGFGPWKTDFVMMGRKTVLKRLLQLLPVEDDMLNDAVRMDDLDDHDVPQIVDDAVNHSFTKEEVEKEITEKLDAVPVPEGSPEEKELKAMIDRPTSATPHDWNYIFEMKIGRAAKGEEGRQEAVGIWRGIVDHQKQGNISDDQVAKLKETMLKKWKPKPKKQGVQEGLKL